MALHRQELDREAAARAAPVAGVAARAGPLCSVAVASSAPLGAPDALPPVPPLLPDARLWSVVPPAGTALLAQGAASVGPRSRAGAGQQAGAAPAGVARAGGAAGGAGADAGTAGAAAALLAPRSAPSSAVGVRGGSLRCACAPAAGVCRNAVAELRPECAVAPPPSPPPLRGWPPLVAWKGPPAGPLACPTDRQGSAAKPLCAVLEQQRVAQHLQTSSSAGAMGPHEREPPLKALSRAAASSAPAAGAGAGARARAPGRAARQAARLQVRQCGLQRVRRLRARGLALAHDLLGAFPGACAQPRPAERASRGLQTRARACPGGSATRRPVPCQQSAALRTAMKRQTHD